MQRHKKEVCRNFQRGFCQYGERCKFLHQQPQGPTNNNPTRYASNDKQPQFKPFENKWTRSGNAPSSQQQQPDATHKCTDPQACKRLIAEDLQNERPLWKLTSYSHWKGLPCDIGGDVSYEELRAVAYDDAKRGMSLQSIVERERNLVSSKLLEFENLLRNPYPGPMKSSFGNNSSGHTANVISPPNNSAPPSVSSFSQLGATLNMGTGIRPSTPITPFGQPSSISTPNQLPNAFGIRPSTPLTPFGQPSSTSTSNESLNGFGIRPPSFSSNAFAPPNSFPGQVQNSNLSGQTNFPVAISDGGFANNMQINSQISMAGSAQNIQSSTIQPLHVSTSQQLASVASGQASTGVQSVSSVQMKSARPVDESIWLKEKWTPGEIPEEAPPDAYCY